MNDLRFTNLSLTAIHAETVDTVISATFVCQKQLYADEIPVKVGG
jgi:hypothetical protein